MRVLITMGDRVILSFRRKVYTVFATGDVGGAGNQHSANTSAKSAFHGNNPLRYVDPLGLVLQVSGDRAAAASGPEILESRQSSKEKTVYKESERPVMLTARWLLCG
jgi:hypothetical protein